VEDARMNKLIHRRNYDDIQLLLKYLKQVERIQSKSLSRYQAYLRSLLIWAGDTPFNQAPTVNPNFIQYLEEYVSPHTGNTYTRETWRKVLGISARFFNWAMLQFPNRYPRKLETYVRTLVLPPSIQDAYEVDYVSYEEILTVADLKIPETNIALRRDQAAACFMFCSGMRVGAFVTMPIMAFEPGKRKIYQLPKNGVKTKNGKQIISYLYPIPELIGVIQNWDGLVRTTLNSLDLWYPRIDSTWGIHEFSTKPPGKNRNQSFNKRMKELFSAAGLPYKSAHNFRRGNVLYGMEKAKNFRSFKTISENLGHSSSSFTDEFYGRIKPDDRKEIIDQMFLGEDAG
jgi:integrase